MKWKSNIGIEKPRMIRKRKLFCWLPQLGSDRCWHWLERIERWEKIGESGTRVLDENTGQIICLPNIRFKLKEGKAEYVI